DEADIGQKLEAKPDPHLLTGLAGLVLARRAIGRAFVTRVPAAAQASLQQRDTLPRLGKVGDEAALLVIGQDLGADGHLDDEVVAAGPCAVGTRAPLAPRSTEVLRVAEVDERIEARDSLEDDVASLAAVAAVRAAELDELLAAETNGSS